IWPNLRLISCWTDAYAALYVPDIKRLFPNVEIQGKGLISTEAFVSFPVTGNNGGVLSVNSHFFEFIEIDDKNTTGEYDKTRLAHELEAGKCYCVVVTTGGGLYRYRLFDIIKVTGYYNQCPVFTFEGKEDNICDCCGEKLNGHHVGRALKAIFEKYNIIPGFYMLAPEKDDKSNTIFYTLFIETENETVIDDCNVIAAVISDLEKSLRENFHYNYCRDLGQLGVARIFRINDSRKAAAIYTEACRSFGQREGNIKPVVLHKKTGWSKLFGGYYV
ncbi:MAG: GH3 auxin-responsive promoter family protein, partial [Clostridiaceae bacterium]|nr:GH3 auxin-responsive promoter family protein [Clostridiaceae bacterium]